MIKEAIATGDTVVQAFENACKELGVETYEAKFEILNENKKVIRVSETNENGQIILSQLMPGTYYIREVKAPDGYEINSELQQIEIKMNEQIKIEIGNSKITIIEKTEIEEPPIEEPKIETPPVIEVPKLPVTGM